jgi:hypothetical protein
LNAISEAEASIRAESSGNFGVTSVPVVLALGDSHASGPMWSGPPQSRSITAAGIESYVVPVSSESR